MMNIPCLCRVMKESYGEQPHPAGAGKVCCLCGNVEFSPGIASVSAWSKVTPAWDPPSIPGHTPPTHYLVGPIEYSQPIALHVHKDAESYPVSDLYCSARCRRKFQRTHDRYLQSLPQPSPSSQQSSTPPQGIPPIAQVPVSPVIPRASQRLMTAQVGLIEIVGIIVKPYFHATTPEH